MILKTIPQSEIFKMRQNYKDSLIDEHNKQQEFLRNVRCIKCGSEVQSKINITNPFSKGKIMPNILSKCIECNLEFNPYSDS